MESKKKKKTVKSTKEKVIIDKDEHFIFEDTVMFKLQGKRGEYAMCSLNKWVHVSKYKWYLGKAGYPICYELAQMTLHKFIFYYVLYGQRPPSDLYIDHVDRNKLNNTDENLRLVTPQENSFNKSTTTNLKGVKKISEGNYTASITKDGIKRTIDNIPTEEAAAEFYNMMAEELFGEYAALNKI